MNHFFLLLILLFIGFSSAKSQQDCSISITGNIYDEHDQISLPYANIFLIELSKGSSSDSLGNYKINDLCAGTYKFRISHIGCETQEFLISIKRDTSINFFLEHHIELLESITVKDKRQHVPVTESSSSISGTALEKITGKSLGEALMEITGVQTLQTGPNIFKPVIHGMHSSRIPIYNQGLRLEGQEWGTDHAPEVDPYSAGSISVVKGASAVRYGIGAIGGIVLLNPPTLRSDPGLGGQFDLSGMSNGKGLSASGVIDFKPEKASKWNWRVQSSFKKRGDFSAPDYMLTNTGYEEFSSSTTLRYQIPNWKAELYYSILSSEMGILRSSHIGNLTDLEEALNSEVPLIVEDFSYDLKNPRQKVIHHLLKLKLLQIESKLGSWEYIYGFQFNQRQEFDIRKGERSNIPSLDMELTSNSIEISLKHRPLFPNNSGQIGLQSAFQNNRNIPGTGVKPLIPWYNSWTTGLFILEKISKDPVTLEAGLRFDFRKLLVKRFDPVGELLKEDRNFSGLSSTIALSYQAGSLDFVSQLGYAFRPPNISELYSEGLHHAVASIEQGNPNLSNERSLKWINSVHFEIEPSIHTGIDLYVQNLWDYIYLSPESEFQLTIRGAFPVFNYLQTNARLWGMDAHFHYELLHDFLITAKGSFIRARDIDSERDLIYMPSDKLNLGLSYIVHGRYQLKDLQFSLKTEHVAKQKRIPENIDYAPPPDGYVLLHFETSTRWALKKNEIHVHFRIENIFNTSHRDYLNRLRYYADEAGRNFELRLNYKF